MQATLPVILEVAHIASELARSQPRESRTVTIHGLWV